MKRKFFLVILSLAMVLGLCLGLTACDFEFTLPEDGPKDESLPGDEHLLYDFSEDGATLSVTGLEEGCEHTKIVVPAVYNGKPVTAISPAAFMQNTTVTEIVLPDSIKRIENFAFDGCSSLEHVDLGEGLEVIGVEAFGYCTALKTLQFPQSLREIDAFAFQYAGLTEVVIPDNVIRVGSMGFSQCTSLTKLTLGKNLKSLGSLAFSHIAAEEIVMPDSVTDLGYGAFAFNTALKSVSVGRNCTALTYGAFFGCTALETVTLNYICAVHDSAFGDCTGLRSVYFYADEEMWDTYCSVGEESDDNPANGYGNTSFREADLYFYSEEPVYDGAHWGYTADGQRTVWQQPAEADPHLTFELNENKDAYTVTGLEEGCEHTKIVISATHEGLPVTAIGENAFFERDKIQEVVLPSSIAEIGYSAFGKCTALETINFPKRLQIIGDYAFYMCTSLEKVELPIALRELNYGAFAFCEKLQSVFIPKHAVMGLSVFWGCTALSEVKMEEGFDGLGPNAFYGCTALQTIELPAGLKKLAPCAFQYAGLTEIVIPAGVETIGLGTFESCTALAKVTLPEGLHYIGGRAFQHTALTEVVIPDQVYQIGSQAFAFDLELESVTLGRLLSTCEYGAFAMCSSLKTVVILNKTTRIDDAAFGGCENIERVFLNGDDWESYAAQMVGMESAELEENGYGNTYLLAADGYCYSEEPVYDGAHWWYGANGDIVVGEKTVAAEPHLTFEKNESGTAYTVTGLEEGCEHTKIVIPATHEGLPVTAIGKDAFWEETRIEEVELPSSVTEIAYEAFGCCYGLKTVNFPKRLQTIGDYAFYGCTSLQKAELPASIRKIGDGAFSYCEELQSAFVPRHAVIGLFAFAACTSLSEVTLEEGFDGLGMYAFYYCKALQNIKLPESLTKIEPFAFQESGLTEIDIPASVETIGLSAFASCTSLVKATFREGLRTIEAYSFQHTALTEVIIPQGVYLIGVQAFAFINELEQVVMGSAYLASCGYAAFAMCPSLKEVTIMNENGNISDAAFGGCDALETVYFAPVYEDMAWETFTENRVNHDSFDNPENGYGNRSLCEAENVYYYSEEPNPDGKHWHFGEDGKPQLWTETD